MREVVCPKCGTRIPVPSDGASIVDNLPKKFSRHVRRTNKRPVNLQDIADAFDAWRRAAGLLPDSEMAVRKKKKE